jgi:D-alanine--poly(phosphoribitol) ligase subunit 2
LKTPAPDDKCAILLEILRETLDPEVAMGIDTDLFEAGLDSMAIMQLLIAIETRLGKAIPVREVTRENFKTPRAILSLLEA